MSRWSHILTSGSSFEVSTNLIVSNLAPLPQSSGIFFTSYIDTQNSFRKTGSIGFFNYPTGNPTLDTNFGGSGISQSLHLDGGFLTSSNMPNSITIPDAGDFRSDVVWNLSGGRFIQSPTISVESVLTYEGIKTAINSSQLSSGSITPPFIPAKGNIPFTYDGEEVLLPGSAISIDGLNSGDVGYADYSNPDHILIEKTSRNSVGNDDNVQFFITCSFSIPYSSSVTGGGLNAYIIRITPVEINRVEILGPFTVRPGGTPFTPFVGLFTGSVIIPDLNRDAIFNGEKIALRIENDNNAKPVQIGAPPGESFTATFQLQDEFGLDQLPSFYFDIEGISGSFEGDIYASSSYLTNVVAGPMPSTKALFPGDGLLFTNPDTFATIPFTGENPGTASIRLWGAGIDGNMSGPPLFGSLNQPNLSGLTFANKNNANTQRLPDQIESGATYIGPFFSSLGLSVTKSLATGNGLEWDYFGSVSDTAAQIKLNSPSGLSLSSFGLRVNPSINSDGLDYSNGVLEVKLQPGFNQSNDLKLSASLPQYGLSYQNATNRNSIQVNFNEVLTSSYALTMSAPGLSPYTPSSTKGLAVGYIIPVFTQSLVTYDNSTNQFATSGSSLKFFYDPPFHTSLSSISGSSHQFISSDTVINLGGSDKKIHFRTPTNRVKFENPFFNLNQNRQNPRGGIINHTSTTSPTSGSSVFFDLSTTVPASFNGRKMYEGGWFLTSKSVVDLFNPNPFSHTTELSSPTSSLDSFEINHIQTVKSSTIFNPNLPQSSSATFKPDNLNSANTVGFWQNLSNLLSSAPSSVLFQDATGLSSEGSIDLQNFSTGIEGDSVVKSIDIVTYAYAEAGSTPIYKIGVRQNSSDPFTNVFSASLTSTRTAYNTTVSSVDLGVLPGQSLDFNSLELQLSYSGSAPGAETYFSGFSFTNFFLKSPALGLNYNKLSEEMSLWNSTSSFSNYGTMYINSDESINTSNVWMYVP